MHDNQYRLTPELILLLRNSYVNHHLSDVETGAAWIDPKRPYGNSNVASDIAELFGWTWDEDDDMPEELWDKCMKLHAETPQALQIVLTTGSFEPGLYERTEFYYIDWRRVGD